MSDLKRLILRGLELLDRVETMLPPRPPPVDWKSNVAFRWRKSNGARTLQAVSHPDRIRISDLKEVDAQKALIEQNTRQFVEGRPANNVLLTGARGTGKSSLVKAVLNRFSRQGLRLIEVEKHDLIDLPDIVDLVSERSERFIFDGKGYRPTKNST